MEENGQLFLYCFQSSYLKSQYFGIFRSMHLADGNMITPLARDRLLGLGVVVKILQPVPRRIWATFAVLFLVFLLELPVF